MERRSLAVVGDARSDRFVVEEQADCVGVEQPHGLVKDGIALRVDNGDGRPGLRENCVQAVVVSVADRGVERRVAFLIGILRIRAGGDKAAGAIDEAAARGNVKRRHAAVVAG